ncbi:hypothetical protein IMZ48_05530 [Candidatus Bathyarchaeota archaeon]|nr:hypothetical protein [Candidatus Bathyarchaeota archaeon]
MLPFLGTLQGPYQRVWIHNDCAGVHNPGSQNHYSGMAPPIVLGTPIPGSPVLSPAVLPPPTTSASGIDVAIHANDGHSPVVKLEDE